MEGLKVAEVHIREAHALSESTLVNAVEAHSMQFVLNVPLAMLLGMQCVWVVEGASWVLSFQPLCSGAVCAERSQLRHVRT